MTVLTLREVAEQLQCSASTIELLIKRGRLAAINLGTASRKHLRVTQQAVDAFLDVEPVEVPTLSRDVIELQPKRFMKRLG